MTRLRIGLAQMNPTVGDLEGNVELVCSYLDRARSAGVDLVAFPELAVTGYPPEDLLLKPKFVEDNLESLREVVKATEDIAAIIGFVDSGADLYNAAAVAADRELVGIYHKIHLPNYGVFDENRYFRPGDDVHIYTVTGVRVGVSICEDIWHETGPLGVQASSGAEILVNISASPYHRGRGEEREKLLRARASDNLAIVAYDNLVGGQDELVFDGNSLIVDHRGELLGRGAQFAEDLVISDLDIESVFRARLHDPRWRDAARHLNQRGWNVKDFVVSTKAPEGVKPQIRGSIPEPLDGLAEVYGALVLGTRDYVRKNGFEKVLIALSGGIDSSLVAAIAVDALGAENVMGVSMPSRFSSPGSITDAVQIAENFGFRLLKIPIDDVYQSHLDALSQVFKGTSTGVAEENLQARARGNITMALSNKFGWLVLATGNKSEMATGYSTLYGDMCGGLAVIKDVPKTMVYALSRHRNGQAEKDLIPSSVLEKAPSAELRPDQKDTDSLPPYELLDPILEAYVEKDLSIGEIVALGFDESMVRRTARLVDGSEFKRRQSTPGIKITPRAFGKDRRLPITNRYGA